MTSMPSFNLFQDDEMENYVPFPRSDFMKKFKTDRKETSKRPSPDACMIDLINKQLRVGHLVSQKKVSLILIIVLKQIMPEGRKLQITVSLCNFFFQVDD